MPDVKRIDPDGDQPGGEGPHRHEEEYHEGQIEKAEENPDEETGGHGGEYAPLVKIVLDSPKEEDDGQLEEIESC